MIYNYITTNILTGKQYIGMSNLKNSKYRGGCNKLKEDIKEFGLKNFTLMKIMEHNNRETAHIYEALFIDMYNTLKPFGYNTKADGGGVGFLKKHSIKTKDLIREKRALQIMQPITEETRLKLSICKLGDKNPMYNNDIHKGRIHTEKSKQNMSKGQLGKIISIEHRKSLSEAAKRYWDRKRQTQKRDI